MIKIYHESPLCFFDQVQEETAGNYFLVHLFEEIPSYFEKAVKSREEGRSVILDNSIFELGAAFDSDKFRAWVELLKPTEYIIPDALEDAETTVRNVQNWEFNLPGKSIGVVQGKTSAELIWCYKEIEPFVDKIAISFDYSLYERWFPEEGKLTAWTLGRQHLIEHVMDRLVNKSKPHHLLGCGLPWEFSNYSDYSWIESIDTSNPVMYAIDSGRYPEHLRDVNHKPEAKLFTLMNWFPDSQYYKQYEDDIIHNIRQFRKSVNG